VQIGNAITEKMLLDVILAARDAGLYTAITDCGAGGFSSAVGEMGAESGAEVWLDKAPLKYSGLSYTEIWISEAQERMVLAVPPGNWEAFERLCRSEGVEATIIGKFTDTQQLVLKYLGNEVGRLDMHFLHEGRPPVIRDAVFTPQPDSPLAVSQQPRYDDDLQKILASLNVCSKEWVIRQYDHEVQAGSIVKPLVGVACDGPSDAAVVRPHLESFRGLVIANGMNPRYGDFDPYTMAAAAIDEAVRNCVAVGADPARIAILDNFCWGNTDRPETLGSLVRAALACRDIAIAYGTPFISGKDSLNNEFSYVDDAGRKQTVAIPPSLLISALGQIADVRKAVTMDAKGVGNIVALVGVTRDELGGSHLALVRGLAGGTAPCVDADLAPQLFRGLHRAIDSRCVRSCHDLSEGGLAVAAVEMSFAGELGLELDLKSLADQAGILNDAVLLFSESNSRFLVEVAPSQWARFKSHFGGMPLVELGKVVSGSNVTIRGAAGEIVIDSSWRDLKEAWKSPLAWD
jgi:phosphoribosylformylglycinamidine synthase